MKAFALPDFDQSPTITEVGLPDPAEGEVRVRVHAASLNGLDSAAAAGHLKGMMEYVFPVVLGKDFAGEVDAIGTGVTDFEVGDRVFGVVMKATLGDGSIGEFVTVPVALGIAKLPDGIAFSDAAALGLAGTAAVDAFDAAQIDAGTTVLVAGATGGVGQQLVQLAVRAGAEVVATASSEEQTAFVEKLGAARTVDHEADVAAQVLDLYPEGVDVVLHFGGSPLPLVDAVKPGGTFVSAMVQSAADVPAEGVDVVSIFASPTAHTLDRVARNQADGHTTVAVQRIYDLDHAGDAFDDFAIGKLGKLVISIV